MVDEVCRYMHAYVYAYMCVCVCVRVRVHTDSLAATLTLLLATTRYHALTFPRYPRYTNDNLPHHQPPTTAYACVCMSPALPPTNAHTCATLTLNLRRPYAANRKATSLNYAIGGRV